MIGLFSQQGFRNPRRAMRDVKFLMSGSSLTDARDLDARAKDAFRDVAHDFFEDVKKSPDPDMTLTKFRHDCRFAKGPSSALHPNPRRAVQKICH